MTWEGGKAGGKNKKMKEEWKRNRHWTFFRKQITFAEIVTSICIQMVGSVKYTAQKPLGFWSLPLSFCLKTNHTDNVHKYNVTNEALSYTYRCSGKSVSITYISRVCICSLRYPVCNAHAPYCHLWSATLYNIFLHYLIHDTFCEGKKLLNIDLFRFSPQNFSKKVLNLRRNERDIIKNVYWSSCKVPVILVRFYRFSKNTQI
jgi:hypothetical protein